MALRGRAWLLYTAAVVGDSMAPTLRPGDFVVVWRSGRPRAGRIVAVRDPRLPQRLLVKRVRRRVIGGWWVEGDNPAASTDSRVFGTVPDDHLSGRVLFRYWRG